MYAPRFTPAFFGLDTGDWRLAFCLLQSGHWSLETASVWELETRDWRLRTRDKPMLSLLFATDFRNRRQSTHICTVCGGTSRTAAPSRN